jgi:serine/threonine protein kinase
VCQIEIGEKDRQNAKNEAYMLKAIQGPTLIKFQESFSDNNFIYIVMEYAEGGNLA